MAIYSSSSWGQFTLSLRWYAHMHNNICETEMIGFVDAYAQYYFW